MRTRRLLTLATLAGGTLAAKRAADNRITAWETNPDTCDGDPLTMPNGSNIEVRASDGATLRGVDCGEGPTVLLVHGWTEHLAFWAPVARRLVDAGFRVVAIDQRGHGASDRGTAPYRPDTLADDVRAWVESLDLSDVVVAGHSMGGLAAMAFATEHAELAKQRVRGLVLVATSAAPSKNPRLPEIEFDMNKFLPTLDRFMRLPDYGLFALLRVFGPRPARSQMEATRAGFLGTDKATRTDAARMLTDFDLREGLPAITIPSVVVAGTHDQRTFLHTNEEIVDLIPGCRLEVLAGLGHQLMFEAPDRVTDQIVQASKPVTET